MIDTLLNSIIAFVAVATFIGIFIGAYINLRTRDAAQQSKIEMLEKDLIKADERINALDRRYEDTFKRMWAKLDDILKAVNNLRVDLQNKQDKV